MPKTPPAKTPTKQELAWKRYRDKNRQWINDKIAQWKKDTGYTNAQWRNNNLERAREISRQSYYRRKEARKKEQNV